MLQLATCEPYFSMIHGDGPIGHYIVIYSYGLDEFYSNEWVDEIKFYIKGSSAASTACLSCTGLYFLTPTTTCATSCPVSFYGASNTCSAV